MGSTPYLFIYIYSNVFMYHLYAACCCTQSSVQQCQKIKQQNNTQYKKTQWKQAQSTKLKACVNKNGLSSLQKMCEEEARHGISGPWGNGKESFLTTLRQPNFTQYREPEESPPHPIIKALQKYVVK